VYSQFRSGSVPPTSNSRPNGIDEDICRDELAIFGGQTRVLVSKLLTSKSPNWDATSNWISSAPQVPSLVAQPEEVNDASKPLGDTMEDVHPSLMEYMALFPPSAFAPNFTLYPEVAQPTLDQSIENETSALPQFTASAELSGYSYPQYSLQQQPPSQPQQQQFQSMTMNPAAAPESYSYDSPSTSAFDTFRDSQNFAVTTPTSASTPETSGSSDLADLGMMMNGDSGMDEQWMSFMRDSGILDRSRTDTVGIAASR